MLQHLRSPVAEPSPEGHHVHLHAHRVQGQRLTLRHRILLRGVQGAGTPPAPASDRREPGVPRARALGKASYVTFQALLGPADWPCTEPRAGRRSRGPDHRGRSRERGRRPDRHQSVRGGPGRELPRPARGRRGRGRRVRPEAPLLPRGGHAGGHREHRRPRLRAVRRAYPADVVLAQPEHAAGGRGPDPPGG